MLWFSGSKLRDIKHDKNKKNINIYCVRLRALLPCFCAFVIVFYKILVACKIVKSILKYQINALALVLVLVRVFTRCALFRGSSALFLKSWQGSGQTKSAFFRAFLVRCSRFFCLVLAFIN